MEANNEAPDDMKFIYWLTLVLITLAIVANLSSCKSVEYVTVPEYHTDTLYQSKVEKDSVWLHDSIHVKERGDTVWVERWHTKIHATEVHDTVYQATHDTIATPYPVEKIVEVEKPLTWWQHTKMGAGVAFILIIVLFLIYGISRAIIKFKSL